MKFAGILGLLILHTSAASAQMSQEADEICRAECAQMHKVVFHVPRGESPMIAPVRGNQGLEAIEIRIHSTRNSNEWVCRLPVVTQHESLRNWSKAVRYGCETRLCVGTDPYAHQAATTYMTILELDLAGIIDLPNPTEEWNYTLRPCTWQERDSGLNPLPEATDQQPSPEVLHSLVTKSPERRCASCDKWWKWRMTADPSAWKREKISMVYSDYFQPPIAPTKD